MLKRKIHYNLNHKYLNVNILKKEAVPVRQKPHCAETEGQSQQNRCLQLPGWGTPGGRGRWRTLRGGRWAGSRFLQKTRTRVQNIPTDPDGTSTPLTVQQHQESTAGSEVQRLYSFINWHQVGFKWFQHLYSKLCMRLEYRKWKKHLEKQCNASLNILADAQNTG